MQVKEPAILGGMRIQEYFRERVQKAVLSYDLQLNEITEFYLVNLLTNFERSDHLDTEPLAMMLAHAMSGDAATHVRELKKLGDTALYVAGFFADHIQNGPVGLNYYVDMGSGAYASLAGQMLHEDVFAGLYSELSEKFADLILVFGDLKIAEYVDSNIELLSLYERWLKTGDDKIRKILISEGLIPTDKKISC